MPINNNCDMQTLLYRSMVRLRDAKATTRIIWNNGVRMGMNARSNKGIIIGKLEHMEVRDEKKTHEIARRFEEGNDEIGRAHV